MESAVEMAELGGTESVALDGTIRLERVSDVRFGPLTRDFVGIFFMYPIALDESAQASTTASSSGKVMYVIAKNPSFLVSSSDVAILRTSRGFESRFAIW